jgi:hypothetical protein
MESAEDRPIKSVFSRFPRRYLFLIVVLILLVPYKTTIFPEWKIRAIDENGAPVARAGFRQSWHNYSYDISGMQFIEGDDNGYAVLPERAFYAPLIYRIPRSALA